MERKRNLNDYSWRESRDVPDYRSSSLLLHYTTISYRDDNAKPKSYKILPDGLLRLNTHAPGALFMLLMLLGSFHFIMQK